LPSQLKTYHGIDFKAIEFGYKKIHKLYEIEEMGRYHQLLLDKTAKLQKKKELAEARKKKLEKWWDYLTGGDEDPKKLGDSKRREISE